MSFTMTLRQTPLRLTTRLPQLSKTALRTAAPLRAFHQASTKKATAPIRAATTTFFLANGVRSAAQKPLHNALLKQTVRAYSTPGGGAAAATPQGSVIRKLLVGGAIFGGTLLTINLALNRETREDGGMPPYERSYLNATFLHTGIGIATIGLAARQMVSSGFVYRIMMTSPWAVAIGGLALSFGTMIGTRAIAPDK